MMSKPSSSHAPFELTGLGPLSDDGMEGAGPLCDPDDQTVISQRPPAPAAPAARPTQPFELGKMLAGERLNHFELREYVGGGGMGAVFRAIDTMLNREVALKVLSRDQGSDEETRRRFQNEAQSAARLDHENIARVYYVGEDRGLNYIVFEFIAGVNLREVVEHRGPLPLAEAISYTMQVAEALAHASSRDVVHRDIKPSNVIVNDAGRAKLVDMGLARLHQVQPDGEELTASGVTLGTFDYISPEQARDPRIADVRSDIYSLGCTLYYMLTARPPFPEGTVLQKLLQHNSDAPPDPRDFNPDLPEELSALVRKMLAKDPRRRYQTANELMIELASLAEQIGCQPVGYRPAWPTRPAPVVALWERHVPWLVPVLALLVLVVLLDVAWPPTDEPLASLPGNAPSTEALSASGVQRPETETDTDLPNAAAPDASKSPPPAAIQRTSPKQASGGASEASAPPANEASQIATDTADSEAENEPATPGESSDPKITVPKSTALVPPAETPVDDSPGGQGSIAAPSAELATSAGLSTSAGQQGELSLATASKTEPTQITAADAKPAVSTNPVGDPPPTGVLVVTDSIGPGRYPSLRAACAAAKTGDAIELQFNGRRDEAPILLSNVKLTIRAKAPFEPVVVFRPNDPDPVKCPRSMLTVAGGSLQLVNVAVELDVPRNLPADSWAMIETQFADGVSLEKCTLTVRNASDQQGAYHQGVAFFAVRGAPGADSMMMSQGMGALDPLEMRLHDCVARGEAVFLRAEDLQPVRLNWNNGLLATTERLLVQSGGTVAPAQPGQLRIELRHVTAHVNGGLCRSTTSADAPWSLETEIRCADSIIMAAADAALVEQSGVDVGGSLPRRLVWSGERNFYQGFSVFWRVTDLNASRGPVVSSFDDWRRIWTGEREVQPSVATVIWKKLAPTNRAWHTRTASDYALNPQASNPALRAASDALDAGLNLADLPAAGK